MSDDLDDPLERRRRQREGSRKATLIAIIAACSIAIFFAGFGVGRWSKSDRGGSPSGYRDEKGRTPLEQFEHITDGLKKERTPLEKK